MLQNAIHRVRVMIKSGVCMAAKTANVAVKTANVAAKIQPDIKESADLRN